MALEIDDLAKELYRQNYDADDWEDCVAKDPDTALRLRADAALIRDMVLEAALRAVDDRYGRKHGFTGHINEGLEIAIDAIRALKGTP